MNEWLLGSLWKLVYEVYQGFRWFTKGERLGGVTSGGKSRKVSHLGLRECSQPRGIIEKCLWFCEIAWETFNGTRSEKDTVLLPPVWELSFQNDRRAWDVQVSREFANISGTLSVGYRESFSLRNSARFYASGFNLVANEISANV